MAWYLVYKGRVSGVYDEWADCQKQVNKFSSNNYKGYATREEAVANWKDHSRKKNRMKTLVFLTVITTVLLYLILV